MREICHDEQEITLAYADDIALIADTLQDLQDAIDRWHRNLSENGMKINPLTSEVMIISRIREQIQVSLEDHQLKQINNFCYLGVTFDEVNNMILEINHCITKYSRSINQLYPMVKDRNIPRKVKVLIYMSILRPILIYGSEAWALTTKTKSRIQAAEMRVLRIIRGVTRLDRLKNEDIRNELGVEAILVFIERSQLR